MVSKKSNERAKDLALKNKIECFDFILMLEFQFGVMQSVNLVSKLMQSPNVDLENVTIKFKKNKTDFTDMRHKQCDEIVDNAKMLAKRWNIDPKLKTRRQKVAKQFFDELASDTVFISELQKFKITAYYASLDIIIAQLSNRFIGFENSPLCSTAVYGFKH